MFKCLPRHDPLGAILLMLLSLSLPARTYAAATSSSADASQPLQEVTVNAQRVLDEKTLSHAVSSFVESHAAAGTRINQIGRWYDDICPVVTGLQPPARDFVTREVLEVARAVGAPTRPAGKQCAGNVEIVFTRQPQALLDHVAKSYKVVLGYFPRKEDAAQARTFNGPIQAWYETGTRSENDHPGSFENTIPPTAQLDSDLTSIGWQPSGSADSKLGKGQRSEFAHVFIIVDSSRVESYSMHSVADYLAMLALTRATQLDKCAPLSSITDLLATGCSEPAATEMTSADRAYLKGLYAAELDKYLNLERGDVHERMMQQIQGK
jgi:hypothetical protein